MSDARALWALGDVDENARGGARASGFEFARPPLRTGLRPVRKWGGRASDQPIFWTLAAGMAAMAACMIMRLPPSFDDSPVPNAGD